MKVAHTIDSVQEWLSQFGVVFYTLFGLLTLCLLALAVVVSLWFLAELPVDYFLFQQRRIKRTFLSVAYSVVRTLLGCVCVLLGLIMLVTPGPGIPLTVLGIVISDFPGKQRLLVNLMRNAIVFNSINWVRNKKGKSPFVQP